MTYGRNVKLKFIKETYEELHFEEINRVCHLRFTSVSYQINDGLLLTTVSV